MHVPWYNSYHSHHGEGDAIRDSLEELLFQNGVDLIFTGHVHSYERSRRVFRGEPNPCGPIHVTIGDGGNREGAALGWEEPEPEWSEVHTSPVMLDWIPVVPLLGVVLLALKLLSWRTVFESW